MHICCPREKLTKTYGAGPIIICIDNVSLATRPKPGYFSSPRLRRNHTRFWRLPWACLKFPLQVQTENAGMSCSELECVVYDRASKRGLQVYQTVNAKRLLVGKFVQRSGTRRCCSIASIFTCLLRAQLLWPREDRAHMCTLHTDKTNQMDSDGV